MSNRKTTREKMNNMKTMETMVNTRSMKSY
jgi:hypothetical protein